MLRLSCRRAHETRRGGLRLGLGHAGALSLHPVALGRAETIVAGTIFSLAIGILIEFARSDRNAASFARARRDPAV